MKEIIKNRAEELLEKEYYCSSKELNADDIVYSINTTATKPYIKIMAYRNSVVICTSKDISARIQSLLFNKNRDEIFELPFVYGQTIHYVPDNDYKDIKATFLGYEFQFLFDKDILTLKGLKGFENSLAFNDNGFTPTRAICIARNRKQIVGISGAALSSVDGLWEIGVDVFPVYRNSGIATYLVKRLTQELLTQNIVPFYSASVTNIGSQMVASRCGYIPIWIDTFGTVFDGSSAYSDITNVLVRGF